MLEANILKVQGVVANCTVTNVVLGSIKVSNTLAFTGSDTAAAEAARNSVATALSSSGTADYFGDSFGDVSISDVKTVTTLNPAGKHCFLCEGAASCSLPPCCMCTLTHDALKRLTAAAATTTKNGVAKLGPSFMGVLGSFALMAVSLMAL